MKTANWKNINQGVIAGLVIHSLLFSSAAAQQDYTEVLTTTQRFGDWILNCETVKGQEKSCVMTQTLFVEGQELLQANFARKGDGTQMTLIFPLGIYLPSGVQLEVVDHIKESYPVNFCSTKGCFVNQIVNPEMVEMLRRKEEARITIHWRADQPVDVPFSIAGFLDAHRKL